ncbi:MAG: hypothetical protein HFH41_04470 [Lachnospiraceae bacterium]|nr:hypothetical protein [Lachnospiraceae bacterium]
MKQKEFVYVGELVPELKEKDYPAFFMNMQKAILISLEKRNLLTPSQKNECLLILEKQYSFQQENNAK